MKVEIGKFSSGKLLLKGAGSYPGCMVLQFADVCWSKLLLVTEISNCQPLALNGPVTGSWKSKLVVNDSQLLSAQVSCCQLKSAVVSCFQPLTAHCSWSQPLSAEKSAFVGSSQCCSPQICQRRSIMSVSCCKKEPVVYLVVGGPVHQLAGQNLGASRKQLA